MNSSVRDALTEIRDGGDPKQVITEAVSDRVDEQEVEKYPNAEDLSKSKYTLRIRNKWPFQEGDVLTARGPSVVSEAETIDLEVIDIERVEDPDHSLVAPSLVVHFRDVETGQLYYESEFLSEIQ